MQVTTHRTVMFSEETFSSDGYVFYTVTPTYGRHPLNVGAPFSESVDRFGFAPEEAQRLGLHDGKVMEAYTNIDEADQRRFVGFYNGNLPVTTTTSKLTLRQKFSNLLARI